MRLSRDATGEAVAVLGLVLAGCGVFLWLGLAAVLGYAGAVLVVVGVAVALTVQQPGGGSA